MALQHHLQLLQFADGEEKYSDSFANFELDDQVPTKSPQPEIETTQEEENVELEEMDEFEKEKSSSSEHEQEEETNDSNLDVAVEFMDDESDGEMMDVLDDDSSESNPSPMVAQPIETNKISPIPQEFSNTIEYQEPPSEFVDDAVDSNDQQKEDNFAEQNPDSNRQPRSHSTSPENFLENEDNI